jgi:hypothetical protein
MTKPIAWLTWSSLSLMLLGCCQRGRYPVVSASLHGLSLRVDSFDRVGDHNQEVELNCVLVRGCSSDDFYPDEWVLNIRTVINVQYFSSPAYAVSAPTEREAVFVLLSSQFRDHGGHFPIHLTLHPPAGAKSLSLEFGRSELITPRIQITGDG